MTAKLANICDVNPLIFSKAENDIYRANNPPILASSCQRDAFIGLFFDGTNNNKYRDLPNLKSKSNQTEEEKAKQQKEAALKNGASNVARLFEAFIASPAPQGPTYGGAANTPLRPPPPMKFDDGRLAPGSIEAADFPYYRKIYIPGLGTAFKEVKDSGAATDTLLGDKTGGLAMALWGEDRIRWALIQVVVQVGAMFGLNNLAPDNELASWVKSKDLVDQIKKRLNSASKISRSFAVIYAPLASLAERYINDTQFETKLKELNGKLADRLPKECQAKLKKIRRLRLTVIGFSRGSAEARAFVNRLQNLCPTIGGIAWEVDFLGVFDTVASVGIANITPGADGHMGWADGTEMTIPPIVKRCVHLVSGHEVRRCFPLDSIASGGAMPPNSLEVVYPGVHSDVGGGYTPMDQGRCTVDSDKISQISLAQMYREARMAGSPLIDALRMPDEVKPLFLIADGIRDKFNAYIEYSIALYGSKPAPIHTVMHQQYQLYLAWRKFRLNGDAAVHLLPGLKASTVLSAKQDIYDIWQLNEMLKEELQPDIKTRLASWITTHADNNSYWQNFLPLSSGVLLSVIQDQSGFQATRDFWRTSNISLAKDKALIELFDLYVHDSRAWFKFGGEPDDEWFGGGNDPNGKKRSSKKELNNRTKEMNAERDRLQKEIAKLKTTQNSDKLPAGWETTVNGSKQEGIKILEAKVKPINEQLALNEKWGGALQADGKSTQEQLWMGAGYLRWRDIYTTRGPKNKATANSAVLGQEATKKQVTTTAKANSPAVKMP